MVFQPLGAGLGPMFSIVGWLLAGWLLAGGWLANPFSSVTTKHNFASPELHGF